MTLISLSTIDNHCERCQNHGQHYEHYPTSLKGLLMPPVLTPQAFVAKWEQVTLNEKAVAQSHFNELCQLLGQPTPTDADPTGGFYRFEKPLTKAGGGGGFADVWKRDAFAWEYKTKGKYRNLDEAYKQLLLYRADLDNPPVLVACDIASYEIHIEFTGHKTRVERFTNADLINAETRDLLRLVLTDPERLRPSEKTFSITEKIAAEFARSAIWVEKRGYDPQSVAHFFMKLLFSMFAEDIGLLPNHLLRNSIRAAILKPAEFEGRVRDLFQKMRHGGYFGLDYIRQFNGGLFDDDDVIPLTAAELEPLSRAAWHNWQDVEPAIFGTLFERSLDPDQRKYLGAHYTSKNDILLLVDPVLMQPLKREWAETRAEIEVLRPSFEAATGSTKQFKRNYIEQKILAFIARLSSIKVLDPACGSGNFLYVALNTLKDLEKEVISYAVGIGLEAPEQGVGPHQLFGIERNPFAAELAQVVVWIGNLQWNSKNGYWEWPNPVLQTLHTIECRDAILNYDEHGTPVEPEWPDADVIVGNPPFLGDKRMRGKLGNKYVDDLRNLYEGRVPGGADLVTYWFEKARAMIALDRTKRAGLIATQGIRGGANRKVLDRIKQSGDIFYAHSDRPWILDGAMVHVSMVGFDDGNEEEHIRNGEIVQAINADLTSVLDLTVAKPLKENFGIAFIGTQKGGRFDINAETAHRMLSAQGNVNNRSNNDVIKPWINGSDVGGRPRDMWIIDFGSDLSEDQAAAYKMPYEYLIEHVKPRRTTLLTETRSGALWWLHQRSRPEMRAALDGLLRYIVTIRHSKYRLFMWVNSDVVPDSALVVIARQDDYFFGVLHSWVHELWARLKGTQLREAESGCRYTPTSTFETFPFPWPPSQEPQGDLRKLTIAQAAYELVQLRDEWLNPPQFGEIDGAGLKDRTLTNLYNKRPDWLTDAHRKLDQAVLDAYGWPHDISDDEILARLLALNLERAAQHGTASVGVSAVAEEDE